MIAQTLKPNVLKDEVISALEEQGYVINPDGGFALKNDDRESWRNAHKISRSARIFSHQKFILDKLDLAASYLLDGKDLDVSKIDPEIIEVLPDTKEEYLFKWWNLVWWSLPYEHPYGRQMRFLIWDKYHNAPIGLIGLQSPILKWKVRDDYLKIPMQTKDYWINQSLSAQRIGSFPPYNDILGGKLVTLLMTSNVVRKKFEKKYANKVTLLENRIIPAKLLFITTTGAYGKSSVYQRLKFNNELVAKFIGLTAGTGTFHIPNTLYPDLLKLVENKGFDIKRGYGAGPSKKSKIIERGLKLLGFKNGNIHGIKRAVYVFPLAKNLDNVIQNGKNPRWYDRNVADLTTYWKERWAIPRSEKNEKFKLFCKNDFLSDTINELEDMVSYIQSNIKF